VREVEVDAGGEPAGQLRRRSQYEFEYRAGAGRAVSLLMPRQQRHYRDGELFAVMDMNLPEGFLLARIRERFPKEPPTKLQLLALVGEALHAFGREVCGVEEPEREVEAIRAAMDLVLAEARKDDRIPFAIAKGLAKEWTAASGELR
jgi:HipA-like protein